MAIVEAKGQPRILEMYDLTRGLCAAAALTRY
jgi:hypothetical protein